MKITIEPTTTVLQLGGVDVRVWVGVTDKGVPCQLFIARVAVEKALPAEMHAAFERELKETAAPRAEAQCWPARLLIGD